MPEFTVETRELKVNVSQFRNNAKTLSNVVSEINSLKSQLSYTGNFTQIKSALERIGTGLSLSKTKLDIMGNVLNQIASKYENTEKKIVGTVKTSVTSIALIAGSLAKRGKILGFDSSGEVSGDLVGASYDIKATTGIKWKYEKDKNGKIIKKLDSMSLIDAKVAGEAHLAKGKIKANVGCIGGGVEGTVGVLAASGHIGANLIKNGKFNPQVEIGAEASAVAAQGSANGKIGSEENNAHVKGDVKLGSAKASASAGIGRVTVKDKDNGEVKTIAGVKGEVKAEAYAAEGRASGGLTICGIKLDVGITGKAGGAGGSVGGYVGTGGVKGNIGAGLGIGVGLDFSIDWSGFKPFWKK